MRFPTGPALGLTAASALLATTLTACGTAEAGDSDPSTTDTKPQVLASTNVWGDVARQVGGDLVDVTSVISDPSQDPHSFEADTDTLLAMTKADVVIENGGGYDDFMTTMIESSGTDATVLDAVDLSGRTAPEGGELNEHVWYDFPSVQAVAQSVASTLGDVDPDHAADYQANADAFSAKLDDLVAEEQAVAAVADGTEIGITEPVPLYLTEAMGLVDATPEEFSEAIEEGDDVSVGVLKSTLDLYTTGAVGALVYNEQTSGPITEQVRAAAEKAGIPVVGVTETLPEGDDYLTWMRANVEAVREAVS